MTSLAELQAQVRRVVAGGDISWIAALLAGRGAPERRLSIHRRHYETSLANALLQKFPATAWLVGTPLLTDAALLFARAHPPSAPCIAEYGEGFPAFLATIPDAASLPYVRSFGELEWHLGQVAVAVDQSAMPLGDLTSFDIEQLPGLLLRLQSGLRYVSADWPIDDLMKLFLSDSAPDSFCFNEERIWLELRGACGAFNLARLSPDDFAFRRAIAGGAPVGSAARAALQLNAAFDLATAFSRLFADNLVTTVTLAQESEPWQ
jgi:hypothetical protein